MKFRTKILAGGFMIILTVHAAHSATMCGSSVTGKLSVDGVEWECLQAADVSKQMGFMRADYVCVTYTAQLINPPSKSGGNYVGNFLSYCTVDTSSYKCNYTKRFSGNTCYACPVGSLALAAPNYHTKTVCNYCAVGYYWSTDQCVPCPNGGTTNANSFQTMITACHIGPLTGLSDETGTYDITEVCFYSLK